MRSRGGYHCDCGTHYDGRWESLFVESQKKIKKSSSRLLPAGKKRGVTENVRGGEAAIGPNSLRPRFFNLPNFGGGGGSLMAEDWFKGG